MTPAVVVAAERARLRDELHDRLGPLLAGINMGLGALGHEIDGDHRSARRRLEELRSATSDALDEVRRILDGLAPAALERGDLRAALEAQASRLGRAGAVIDVDIPAGVADLPAAAESAAYRIASEALHNAVRHAHADTVRVAVRRRGAALEVVVADDGRGIEPGVRDGVGLVSMRACAEQCGGALVVECPGDGGTRVTAWLPLGLAAEAAA